MNLIDQKLSAININHELLKFNIDQKNAVEYRQKLKKTNRTLFNTLSLLPFGLISSKPEYCRHYYGYEHNKTYLLSDASKLVNTQFVSYEYEKYLNNDSHKNYIYDTKRLKNYNKVPTKTGSCSRKSKVNSATGEIKNNNNKLFRETRKLKRSMKKCTIPSLNLSLESILSEFKISNGTKRFIQIKRLESNMIRNQNESNKNDIQMNKFETVATSGLSIITLTDDDFENEKKSYVTGRSLNDYESLSPNSSVDYFNDNFFSNNNQSFQILNSSKPIQFVKNYKDDSLYNSTDDEKSDQSQSNITITSSNNYNDKKCLMPKENLQMVKNSPLKVKEYSKGGIYDKFVQENKSKSVNQNLSSVNYETNGISLGIKVNTRTIVNIKAFDPNISPNASQKLTNRINFLKLSSYDNYVVENKKAQNSTESPFFNDKHANNISDHLKTQCAMSKDMKIRKYFNNQKNIDEVSDYDKIEVIDLT